ncbi:DUF456 domain-containing protein [Haladaptatus sp. CMAA 1911]|uniref:DUF456 domain-containing protein n=1 Tax=unclassified Haladaptatus TaxID=2622732 RepID=UPI00375497A2
MDWPFLLALVLLLGGVLGSVVPLLPGVPLSLAGIYAYWWWTGFGTPGLLFVVIATLLGVAAVLAEYAGGAISARAGGGSVWSALVAGIVGLVALLTTGPLGMLLAVALATFAVELARTGDFEHGTRTAAFAVVGLLASAVFQLLVTGTLLVGFLAATVF